MKKIIFVALLASVVCKANVFKVGSSRLYVSPNALYQANVVQAGDTIEIDSDIYSGTPSLAAWQVDNLLIRGIGGRPHLIANGQAIWGKGIWVLAGDNITVENIEFSEASVPDENGAGIRLDGVGLTVRNCYFHDNENGILTNNSNAGDILIEYSEFNHNGFGDGQSHNLYIGKVNKLTFKYNYSHHAYIGHNLKSRAKENIILYNKIMDESTGESSRLIDLPAGGFSVVMGNLLMQGNSAQNNNLVGYGLEGLQYTQNDLYVINNTLVNKRTASCRFVQVAQGIGTLSIQNNIFTGTGNILSGSTESTVNNIVEPIIANVFFTDESNYDYSILSNSPAVDAGVVVSDVNSFSLTPSVVYVHPANFALRAFDSGIDAGAYEFGSSFVTVEDVLLKDKMVPYPNPFVNQIIIENVELKQEDVSVVNSLGQVFDNLIVVSSEYSNTKINTERLVSGIYFVRIKKSNKLEFSQRKESFVVIKK